MLESNKNSEGLGMSENRCRRGNLLIVISYIFFLFVCCCYGRLITSHFTTALERSRNGVRLGRVGTSV